MTTVTHETEITTDPTVPLIRITREFDAPRAMVFRAHTDPDLLVAHVDFVTRMTRMLVLLLSAEILTGAAPA